MATNVWISKAFLSDSVWGSIRTASSPTAPWKASGARSAGYGRSSLVPVSARAGPFCFYAFDLLWLDGSDLRDRPLFERKTLLRKLLPRPARSVLYVEHVASGMDLLHVICDRDMGGDRCEAGERTLHAGSHNVGQNQEPREQSSRRTRGPL
jgi:hypothetical protein